MRQADQIFRVFMEHNLAAVQFAVDPGLLSQANRIVVVGIFIKRNNPAWGAPGDAPGKAQGVFISGNGLICDDQRITAVHSELEAAIHIIDACPSSN